MASRRVGEMWILLLMAAVVAGCGTVNVKYIVEPQRDEAGLMKFRLAGSTITLAVKEGPAKPDPAKPDQPVGQAPKTGYKLQGSEAVMPPKNIRLENVEDFFGQPAYFKDVDVLVTPGAGSEVLALVIHDPFWQKTVLSYSYHDVELLLLKSVGTEVTDNSKAIIDAVGSIVSLLIVFGAFALDGGTPAELLTLPVTIDVPTPVTSTKWRNLPLHKAWWYRIERRADRGERKVAKRYPEGQIGQDSGVGDTVNAAEFLSRYSNDGFSSTNAFPVAGCQQVIVHVRHSKNEAPKDEERGTVEFLRTVADPSRVRTIAIPSKGVISLGPICGGWVDSKATPDPGWPALEEAAKQIKSLKEALDKKEAEELAKKPGQKPSK